MSFKLKVTNAIQDQNVAYVFCDEPSCTVMVLGKTVLINGKSVNCLSVNFIPRTKSYRLTTGFLLPGFRHRIFNTAVRVGEDEAITLLKSINVQLEKSA